MPHVVHRGAVNVSQILFVSSMIYMPLSCSDTVIIGCPCEMLC